MKYIRTKENVYLVHHEDNAFYFIWVEIEKAYILIPKEEVIAQANTIEELCDEFVIIQKDFRDLFNADTHCLQTLKRYYEINKIEILGIYGAIWTDKGLTYVAKMDEKGELELL